MADFYQSPHIATLHNLRNRSVEELEAQLVNFSASRPLGLILPSLYSELETDAMPLIRSELQKVPYLSQIVIGLDRADQGQYESALSFFKGLPQQHRVMWHTARACAPFIPNSRSEGLLPMNPVKDGMFGTAWVMS